MNALGWTRLSVELVLLSFHLSVTLVIAVHVKRRHPSFTTGFFVIYLLQGLNDWMNYLATGSLRYDATPRWLYFTCCYPNFFYALCGFVTTFQLLSHAFIALNRYTAILHPIEHRIIWSGRYLVCIITTMTCIALLTDVFKITGEMKVIADDRGVSVSNASPWMSLANRGMSLCLSISTTFASCFLELRTFLAFRRLTPFLQRKHREDFRLLMYAIVQFIAQVFLTAYYIALLLERQYPALALMAHSTYSYIIGTLSLSGPIALFAMSKTTRKAYLQFYGCRQQNDQSLTSTTAVWYTSSEQKRTRSS